MAIKKVQTKKRTYAAASTCGSCVAMVEMSPHGPAGGADHIQAPPPLPPGVYFSPTPEECLGFLNRWIAGDSEMADARGFIFGANVYGESPDALRRRHPPASIRGPGENAWWFLSETRFQSQTVGGGASKRADRRVETGGYWRLEQSSEKLEQSKDRVAQQSEEQQLEEAEGVKNSFGFYTGLLKKQKTSWLMQEFTSANDDGTGKRGVPALYRVYVTPRADDDKLRAIFGEDGVKKGPDGKKKPARAMVPNECFDRIAELLPQGSVRHRGVLQQHECPPSPLRASQGLLQSVDQQLDQYQQQHEEQQNQQLDQCQQQQHEEYLDQYQQQQHQEYLCPYQQQQHEEYLGPYQQQQHEEYLGPYQQQQGPFLGEFTADDNLSMPMDEFLGMIDEQPPEMDDEQRAEMGDEQPAETAKGGEPNWGALDAIVDDDELASFNKEG